MNTIDHQIAIITHKDHVEAKGLYVDYPEVWERIGFQEVGAKDDIGAGDSFNVGFLDYIISNQYDIAYIHDAINKGIEVAQEKVTNIGVFL